MGRRIYMGRRIHMGRRMMAEMQAAES